MRPNAFERMLDNSVTDLPARTGTATDSKTHICASKDSIQTKGEYKLWLDLSPSGSFCIFWELEEEKLWARA